MKTKNRPIHKAMRRDGFSTSELMISMGITGMLALGVFIAMKGQMLIGSSEKFRTDEMRHMAMIKETILKDLANAPQINGYSYTGCTNPSSTGCQRYVAVRKIPETVIDPSANDKLELLTEVFGELPLSVSVDPSDQNDIKVYYPLGQSTGDLFVQQLLSQPQAPGQQVTISSSLITQKDAFAKALLSKKWFSLANFQFKNIAKRVSDPVKTSCPDNNSNECLMVQIEKPTYFDSTQMNPNDRFLLRALQQIDYVVNGDQLCRQVDNSQCGPMNNLLDHVSSFHVSFSFKSVSTDAKDSSGNDLRFPPKDTLGNYLLPSQSFYPDYTISPAYQTQQNCIAGQYTSKCVDYGNIDVTQISITRDFGIPQRVAMTNMAGFEMSDPQPDQTKHLLQRITFRGEHGTGDYAPVTGVGTAVKDECLDSIAAQCNPDCKEFFTSTDPNSPWYVTHGDPSSDYCVCGTVNGSFYPADLNWGRIPAWSSNPTDQARLDACTRVYPCVTPDHNPWFQGTAALYLRTLDPWCGIAAECLQPSDPNSQTDKIDKNAITASVQAGGNNLYCQWGGGGWCDINWNWIQTGTETVPAPISLWQNKCACEINALDQNGNPSGNLLQSPQIQWQHICDKTPGSVCDGKTYDSTQSTYKNLTADQATQCECLLNNVTTSTGGTGLDAATLANQSIAPGTGAAETADFLDHTAQYDPVAAGYSYSVPAGLDIPTKSLMTGSFKYIPPGQTTIQTATGQNCSAAQCSEDQNSTTIGVNLGCCVNLYDSNWPYDQAGSYSWQWLQKVANPSAIKDYCSTGWDMGIWCGDRRNGWNGPMTSNIEAARHFAVNIPMTQGDLPYCGGCPPFACSSGSSGPSSTD